MQATTIPARNDTPIRDCMETLLQALRAKDIDTLMAHYAPAVVTFDARPPLQVQGAEAYRKNFTNWFASMQGPIVQAGQSALDLRP